MNDVVNKLSVKHTYLKCVVVNFLTSAVAHDTLFPSQCIDQDLDLHIYNLKSRDCFTIVLLCYWWSLLSFYVFSVISLLQEVRPKIIKVSETRVTQESRDKGPSTNHVVESPSSDQPSTATSFAATIGQRRFAVFPVLHLWTYSYTEWLARLSDVTEWRQWSTRNRHWEGPLSSDTRTTGGAVSQVADT